MKIFLVISLFLIRIIAFSQIIEHFDDGDFTRNPVWQGDVGYFEINAENQLQSRGPQLASQIFSLSTANTLASNVSWSFFVRLNFDPTTTNYPRIYLVSNNADLTESLNGYFIQIGETGSTDGIHLYQQNGTSTSRIITGSPKARTSTSIFSARIKVTRDTGGNWQVFSDVSGGENFILEGEVNDITHNATNFFGVYCRYATASRYNQFIFDDFVVEDLIPDTIPPSLVSVKTVSANAFDLTFSEAIDSVSALQTFAYTLSGGFGSPISVQSTAENNVYRLLFANNLPSGNYSLQVNMVADLNGNIIFPNSNLDFLFIKPHAIQPGDIVINEIFANPTGNQNIPAEEFVELWNTTDEYLITEGWKYFDQTSIATFGLDTIAPNQYLILCARADTSLFKPFGKTIGLSPWPSLNNDGDVITLTDSANIVIDQVAYLQSWYKDDTKDGGGFSLELIDPENICSGIQNWQASIDDAGATPGRENSVYRSQLSNSNPELVRYTLQDSITIVLEFSKALDSLSAVQSASYSLNNNAMDLRAIVAVQPAFTTVILTLATPIARGIDYTLTLNNLSDCAGNRIDESTVDLFLAEKIGAGDILISEILFNPKPDGVDFVEIYNNSNTVRDLRDLQIAHLNSSGILANIKAISADQMIIQPGTYWVLTTNSLNIQNNYDVRYPQRIIELESLPAYNNDRGTVFLLNDTIQIDRFDYTENMHTVVVRDIDGISLERISFTKDANAPGNFRSAAASVGFATPTYKNSQETTSGDEFVILSSQTFSPDGDGYEDLLTLNYQLNTQASLATVQVFNDKGRLIRKLIQNQTVSTVGSLVWDGLNDGGQRQKIGIYVVVFDVFYLDGKRKSFKNTCVLAGPLN